MALLTEVVLDFQTVSLKIEDHVGILTLNRPDERNAMTVQMAHDFKSAVAAVDTDPRIKVLVLTGAGPAFCAGADLDMLSEWTRKEAAAVQETLRAFYGRFLSLTELTIPTLAAVNGPAIGAGACLAMACDLRIAAAEAIIGFTFIKLGLNPGMGAEHWLSRAVGPSRAMQLLMTGDILSAEEALSLGLLNQVTPRESLSEHAMDLASRIAVQPAMPIRTIKEIVRAAPHNHLSDILRMESERQSRFFKGPNVIEGIHALRENRAARFVDEAFEAKNPPTRETG